VPALPLAAAGAERREAAPLADDPRVSSALELARVWLEAQRACAQIPGVSRSFAIRRSSGAGKGETPDPGLGRYAGTCDGQAREGEVAVLPWEHGLAVLELPTMNRRRN
jgi:hypothetical protein